MNPKPPPRNGIIKHRCNLKLLAQEGLIAEPPEHVRPKDAVWGPDYHYVDSVEGGLTSSWQPWSGREIRLTYIDGCFLPFVEYRHTD